MYELNKKTSKKNLNALKTACKDNRFGALSCGPRPLRWQAEVFKEDDRPCTIGLGGGGLYSIPTFT